MRADAVSEPLALPTSAVRLDVARVRRAQAGWNATPLERRLRVVREARHRIAERAEALAGSVASPRRVRAAETLSAEVLPLADALRFLEREAPRLLAPRTLGRRGRPFWLQGSAVELLREPWGVVLVIGPANYPLFLPGVQAAQALVAGNAVLLKPGRGGRAPAEVLAAVFRDAGLPAGLLTVLDESPDAAKDAIAGGVDKVVLTGSLETGRSVLERLAPRLTPAVMELSGCDPVFVLPDANVDLAARALRFGLTLNGGFTCIAPRRVLVARDRARELEERLVAELREARPAPIDARSAAALREMLREALDGGARLCVGGWANPKALRPTVLADGDAGMRILHADVAAPLLSLIPFDGEEQALELAGACDFALGATVFGGHRDASRWARRVDAGVVVVNDMIVPTADPRVPFGGRGASGFGATRGGEGLVAMTRAKTILRRRGRFRPHYDPIGDNEEQLLQAFLQVAHARSLAARLRAVLGIAGVLVRSRRPATTRGKDESGNGE